MRTKPIKIVKRKDIEQANNTAEFQSHESAKDVSKVERRSRRELVNTVSKWVAERRERRRSEEIESLRRLLGDSSILGEA